MKKVMIFVLLAFGFGYAQDVLTEIGRVEGEFERAYGLAFSEDGNFAYIPAKGQTGPIVHIINITDPSNPTTTGMTPIQITSDKTPEAWGVKVVGDLLYVAAFKDGLYIYDISTPTVPVFVGSFFDEIAETKSESREVFVKDGVAYIAEAWQGLRMVDVSDPTEPVQLALYNTSSDINESDAEFHDVKVVGNYAYSAAGDQGLVIVDVRDPSNPAGVGACCDKATIGEGSWGRGVDVYGNYAYLGDNYTGLRIADISDPEEPYEVGSFVLSDELSDELWKVKAVGSRVFVPYSDKFYVLDVSTPANPIELANGSLVGRGQAVLIKGNYAYVTTYTSFFIFDVSSYLAIRDEEPEIPINYQLHQNYPNPFNSATTIEYELKEPGWVNLKVYDIHGKEVVSLVNDEIGVGLHRVNWFPTGLASGIYFYTISVNEITQTRKLIFLR